MTGLEQIIRSSVDSDSDLLKLAKAMDVKVDQIVFKQYLNKNKEYSILNMGTPMIGGSHWIAVSNKDKLYFDPLGLPPPKVIPRDYKYYKINIQDYRYGHCGDFVVLWLWYLQHDKLSDFYKSFKLHAPLI
jgi:hypothetical protein